MVEIYGAEAAKFVDILKEKLEQLKGVSSAGFVGTKRLQNWNVTNIGCEKQICITKQSLSPSVSPGATREM